MNSNKLAADDWIESLALSLRKLSAAQEPYLQEYYRQHPRVHDVSEEPGNKHAGLPSSTIVRDLYAIALPQPRLWGRGVLCAAVRGAGPGSEYFAVASHAGCGS